MSDTQTRFQPVILVIEDGRRLECLCGAIATFVALELNEDGSIAGYEHQCQDD